MTETEIEEFAATYSAMLWKNAVVPEDRELKGLLFDTLTGWIPLELDAEGDR